MNSQLACGENRFSFSFLDATHRPIATPDRSARVALYDGVIAGVFEGIIGTDELAATIALVEERGHAGRRRPGS